MQKSKINIEMLREQHRAGQLDEAKQGYLNILRKNPRNIDALHSLGILCAQQENFSDAIDYLKKAIEYQPNDPTLQLHLANVFKVQGLFSQAAQVLQKTIQSHPNYVPAFNNLGTIYYAQANLSEAIHFFRIAIEKQADYVDAHYNLGLALAKQNKLAEAVEVYTKLLQTAPEHFAARFHLACTLMLQENSAEALKHFLLIEQSHPYHLETQTNLATCYLKKGSLNEAKSHYLKALELAPKDTQILFNLGVINMQQGYIDSAIQSYQQAVAINPNDFSAHNNLGVAFLARPHVGFALHHFQEALRIQPKNEAIQYTVNMLSQHHHLLAAPPGYVQSLFDAYADHYEPHLLTTLDYQVPQLLHKAVAQVNKIQNLDILDLGCGTGLCGIPFKPLAKTLIGVDLSAKMLVVAAQKKIYDELIAGELTAFLTTKKTTYDLIIAGDVLVYIGDLKSIFNYASVSLRNKGLFAFNTEICEDTDYRMNQSGRFSHRKEYIDQLAEKNHFTIAYYQNVITRMQNNEPVHGHLYVLKKIL